MKAPKLSIRSGGRAVVPVLVAGAFALFSGQAAATPWMPSPTIPAAPTLGTPTGPDPHPGKEYSSELDSNAAGALDAEQVILWDGVGGVADAIDYNAPSDDPQGPQVDAIANHADALYGEVTSNRTAAAFSLREVIAPTTPGPGLPPSGAGMDLPGAPVLYETTGGAIGTWATPPVVNSMNPPVNLDGLEVWGPEGPTPAHSDSDRFSLVGDVGSGTSIFNSDGTTYLTLSDLVSLVLAVRPDLGNYQDFFDLDALMVQDDDVVGRWDTGDSILFSLWPFFDPGAGLSYWGDEVYLATMAAAGPMVTIQSHGGHLWANGWTIAAFGDPWNVDALEALAAPEPGSLALLGLALVGLGLARRRAAAG